MCVLYLCVCKDLIVEPAVHEVIHVAACPEVGRADDGAQVKVVRLHLYACIHMRITLAVWGFRLRLLGWGLGLRVPMCLRVAHAHGVDRT